MVYSSPVRHLVHRLSCEEFEPRICLCVSFPPQDASYEEIELLHPRDVFAADLDGDGDADVIYDGGWFENVNGKGNLVHRADLKSAIGAADIDGDGDMDVLSSSGWHENTDGKGGFGPASFLGLFSPVPADVDGDGDVDLLGTYAGDIVWVEKTDGAPQFGESRARKVIFPEPAGGTTTDINAVDIDGDGDLDVLSASRILVPPRVAILAWYENIDGNGSFGEQYVIRTTANSNGRPRIDAADLDGDGDIDVLSDSGNEGLAWYENTDGNGTFVQKLVFSRSGLTLMHTVDFDLDGDVDVLSHAGEGLVWYENTDGKGTFGPQAVFVTTADGTRSVYAADMDGDGDLDVLSANDPVAGIGSIVWYENSCHQSPGGDSPVGDANGDDQFDQRDIIQVLQANRYLTGEPSTFEEGDWNGDHRFDQLDLIAALLTGIYLPN